MPGLVSHFNSTLTGNARVWFDKLPKESIDSYEDLRTAFRENYLQQTKHIKDPVEIHHIKQRDGESTEDFMERYKAEVLDVEGAPICMRISGFMHGITHPGLIKRLYERIQICRTELYRMTKSSYRGSGCTQSWSKGKHLPYGNIRGSATNRLSKKASKISTRRIASRTEFSLPLKHQRNFRLEVAKPRIPELLSGDSNVFPTANVGRRDGKPLIYRRRNRVDLLGIGYYVDAWALRKVLGRHKKNPELYQSTAHVRPKIGDRTGNENKAIKKKSISWMDAGINEGGLIITVGYLSGHGLDRWNPLCGFPFQLFLGCEGMFLGYKVSTNGLKACPDKADAVLSLPSPRCIKDVQKLNGKLAKSPNSFTAPKEREEFNSIYLAAAKEAFSAVLMTDREGRQIPVYFVSRTLRGRKMLKWKFEIEGYDIQYRPRTAIKRQILADFIVERPEEGSPDELMAEPEVLPSLVVVHRMARPA
ncbi:reverse transcriptase domain-containing protein [Tanacetum coccineum]